MTRNLWIAHLQFQGGWRFMALDQSRKAFKDRMGCEFAKGKGAAAWNIVCFEDHDVVFRMRIRSTNDSGKKLNIAGSTQKICVFSQHAKQPDPVAFDLQRRFSASVEEWAKRR